MHYIAGLWRDLGSLRLFRLSVGSRAMAKPSGEGSAVACLPLCPDVDSAVYVDRLAGDVVTVFYQETGGPGDLFGLAEASERHLFAKFLLGFLGDVGDHIGLDKAGAEAFTVIPNLASSRAAVLVKPSNPALAAE